MSLFMLITCFFVKKKNKKTVFTRLAIEREIAMPDPKNDPTSKNENKMFTTKDAMPDIVGESESCMA